MPIALAVGGTLFARQTGVTWNGGQGITESVAQIMARKPAPETFRVRPVLPRFIRSPNIPQNPNSPDTAQWPAPNAKTPVLTPSQTPLFTPQVVGTSFLGAQISDTIGYVPPDSMADAGWSQILVCVNGRIRTFTKDGAADGVLNATTDQFFSSVLDSSSTADPRVRFDRLSGRWFVTMITTVNSSNLVLLAVSSGPTITTNSSFTFFSFTADPVNFGDYDTLGVDANALYIGVNVFDSNNNLVNTTGFVVNKTNLMNGTLTVTTFTNLIDGTGAGPETPQGVNNDDPNATEGYFIGVDANAYGTLVVRRVSDPAGTPVISTNILITVPATDPPMGGVPALGSTNPLDDLDDRLFAARMHDGVLWTAHNIEVNSTGVANSHGGRDGSRWYEITNMTGTPSVLQSGTLYDTSSSNPTNYWIPSC
ncbi:MAG: hypothetical protein KGR98_14250, partial [Verrucomicrobia bacterium]|nr:hypothetical protein [Verrucomicrobiota bacterium]